MRAFWILLCLLSLAACSQRGLLEFVDTAPPAHASKLRVHIATERNLEALDGSQFGQARSDRMHFGWVDISIPPTHEKGVIEWPGNARPDPAQHFVATGGDVVSGMPEFLRRVERDGVVGEAITVFVHGYNTNNAEAVYLVAQTAHDYGETGSAVLFSWPSAAKLRGYVYDRDSVMFARDALERLLTRMTAATGRPIQIVAHSMGTQLVMETLRQMSISGNRAPLRALDTVVLVSPDIDEDVFRRQMARIEPVPEPFMVLVTEQDKALSASAWLTGNKRRLGAIRDTSALEGLPITVVDLSKVSDGRGLQHKVAFESAAAIDFILGLADLALEPVRQLTVVAAEAVTGSDR